MFGCIIMASSFNMPCVEKNFLFLSTGLGKGVFNFFVGSLLLTIKTPGGDSDLVNEIMGASMMASGCIFVFLSKVKKMEDEDLVRALSVYADADKANMKKKAKDTAHDNKDAIKKAAIDNKDVIASVVYDNKEVIGQVAYENRDVIAQEYINQQNS